MKTKRSIRRSIERKLDVSKLLKFIPNNLLEQLADELGVDFQVKHLFGALMFQLFLYTILKSERISTHILEHYYNSKSFSLFANKGEHQTLFTSISDRLKVIKTEYFENIFKEVRKELEKHFIHKSKQVLEILRFDSTMVAVGAGLVDFGMDVGVKAKTGNGKKQIKYTIGLKDMLPSDIELYTEKEDLCEDNALGKSILKSQSTQDAIVTFDRGLKKRKTFCEMDDQVQFVTRLKIPVRYLEVSTHKQIEGRESETLIFEKDIIVNLYGDGYKLYDKEFRLIIAKRKKNGEQIAFLTNNRELNMVEISNIYKHRWDIEVYFRFLKQEINLKELASLSINGIKVMMYMILIASMLILIYKKVNKIPGYKIAKVSFEEELSFEITKYFALICGADPKKVKDYSSNLYKISKNYYVN